MLLYTERLTIREMAADDWTSVREIARDFSSGPYALYDHPLPETDIALQETVRFFAKSGAVYSILLKESEEMIGYVCLWPAFLAEGDGAAEPHKEARELGYCFHSAYHGHGYAFEAISTLIEQMAHQHVHTFLCGTALDNAPSMRLIKRLGFVQTAAESASFHKDASGREITFASGSFRKDCL